jgi:hypothetical protein
VTKPKPETRADVAAIEDIVRQNNFPSRQAAKSAASPKRQQRRYRTKGKAHRGIKATTETVERLYRAADERMNATWRTANCCG